MTDGSLTGKLIEIKDYLNRSQSEQECRIQREIDFLISELDYCLKILKHTHSNQNRIDAIRWMQSFVRHCEDKLVKLIGNPP